MNDFTEDNSTKYPMVGEQIQKTAMLKISKKQKKNPKMCSRLIKLKVFFRQIEQTNYEVL